MPYIRTETKAGKTLIVEKYYTSRWNRKGVKRSANHKPTSEAQEKCNQRKTERHLTILMNENFSGNDYHLVLDYAPSDRPSTPSGSPSEHPTVFAEDAQDVPESGHGNEIHRNVRVWQKRRPASPSGDKPLPGRHDGRHPKKVDAWKNPL